MTNDEECCAPMDCGPKLVIANRVIGNNNPVFFIAEVGQNHQGNIEIAKKLIDAAKDCGADCVKFQKTNINEKFTKTVLERPYNNVNSWGKTYGEHKQYLEFTEHQFRELQEYSRSRDILFTASPMDLKSLEFLLSIEVPFLKIGSGDVNNIPMLIKASQSGKPLIISTGMQPFESARKIYSLVRDHACIKDNFALLHCVSAYPTPLEDINLKVIELYRSCFPEIVIGYSGHELGIDISLASTVLGAKIIERHITLDQNQKGSDHKCSLLPEQFRSMIEKTKQLQRALGIPKKMCTNSERSCWEKLGKTIVAAKTLKSGDQITENDITIKVADPKGIDGIKYADLLYKTLNRDVDKDDPIMENYYE